MNFVRWLLWGPVRWSLSILPYDLALASGRIIGFIACYLLAGRRRILNGEYSRIFPQKTTAEIKRIVRDAFMLWGMNEVDYLLHSKLGPDNIEQMTGAEGLSLLDESLKRKRGVILTIFHFGCHMQVMPALGFRGYSISQVTNEWTPAVNKAAGNPVSRFVARQVFKTRLKHSGANLPVEMIPVRPGGFPRALFDSLNRNRALIIALDGRDVGKVVYAPFFHSSSYPFASGPINLAMRTDAPVHPIFVVRQENGRNKVIVERELVFERQDSREESILHNTAKAVEVLREYVLRYPGHYGMEIFRNSRDESGGNGHP